MLNSAKWQSDLADAWLCLKYHRIRSILSALGVAIGTMALVSMLSIGEGAKRDALDRVSALGVNLVRIENLFFNMIQAQSENANLAIGLTQDHAKHIQSTIANVTTGIFIRESEQSIYTGGHILQADVLKVNPAWIAIESLEIRFGRGLGVDDEMNQVCLMGAELAKQSGAVKRIGEAISWEGGSCQLVGILAEKGRLLTEGTALSTIDFDNTLYLPIGSYLPVAQQVSGITLAIDSDTPEVILQAASRTQRLLDASRHTVADYRLLAPVTLLKKAEEEQRMFTLIMGAIAGLSLLVGGIGIMNVMLAHIAEQTREIGLRMAFGADKPRVVSLILSYSMILSLGGTLIGLLGGILLAYGVQFYATWPIAFSLVSLVVGPLFSLAIGTVFGVYPALKASAIQPSIALRQM